MADDRTRPAHWPRWIPPRCRNGHALWGGRISMSWVNEPGCPANTDGRGHHIAVCVVGECYAEMRPEACAGT